MFDFDFDFSTGFFMDFDTEEEESKTSPNIVSTKENVWEEMKSSAVDVEFEEIKL
jgi:hypothetical protein